ncbi:hypothetical protein BJ742DRAFT_791665 [Cladochytrium replicatum]|nr:hypothetical protein BJ742DRAFT_791665 [Cladochytrium replicatum]
MGHGDDAGGVHRAARLFRIGDLEACVDLCTKSLESLPSNAITAAATALRAHAIAAIALRSPPADSERSRHNQSPAVSISRPSTAFARKGLSSRSDIRPSESGRLLRGSTLGSLSVSSGRPSQSEASDIQQIASNTAIARATFIHLFESSTDSTRALELAICSSRLCRQSDWWWEMQSGRCFARLGMLPEAQDAFKLALSLGGSLICRMHFIDMLVRAGDYDNALEVCRDGLGGQVAGVDAVLANERAGKPVTKDQGLLLAMARIYKEKKEHEKAFRLFKQVIVHDPTSVEAIANVGTHLFYENQPELAIKYFRRLIELGVNSSEVWNNLGLCQFYAQDYDGCIPCFERALSIASDADPSPAKGQSVADIWYNLSHVNIVLGDLCHAHHCLRLAISQCADHAEAWNNLAVLEVQLREPDPFSQDSQTGTTPRGRESQSLRTAIEKVQASWDTARSYIASASRVNPGLYEPWYNAAMLHFRTGNLHQSYVSVTKSLEINPAHVESKELMKSLKELLAVG